MVRCWVLRGHLWVLSLGAASACGVLTPACVWVVVLVGWGVVVC